MMRSLGVLIRTLLDLSVLSIAYFGAFFLRFDGGPPLQMVKLLMFTWPYVVGFELVVLYIFSVPYFASGYGTERLRSPPSDERRIIRSVRRESSEEGRGRPSSHSR